MSLFNNFFALSASSLLILFACSKGSDTTTTTTPTPVVSGGTNPEPIVVTSCATSAGISKLICLADAFKSKLDASQLSTVQRTYDVAEAKKWSNLPQNLVQSANKRIGIAFSSLTSTQIQYAKALIKEAAGTASNEGWEEIQHIINADEYLLANGGGATYGAGNYYIALLGTPSLTGTWELQFGGHHLAFANTYKNGVLVGATPAFRSSEPFASFAWNSVNNQPLVQEKDALAAMLNGLSATELATAKLSSTFSDLVVGPQKDGQFPTTPSGIKVGNLSATQKALVIAAIKTYTGDIADTDANSILAKYTNELDNTYISYSGNTSLTTQNDYVRIDGPSVWIEYSCQRGIVLSPTHPHSVWRDKTSDYGGN
jgi:hypothetical protein